MQITADGDIAHRFGQFLRDQKRAILDAWGEQVRDDDRVRSSEGLDRQSFHDHLPDVLDSMSTLLERGEGEGRTVQEVSRIHGHHRWLQDYSLTEVVLEIERFRQILIFDFVRRFAEVEEVDESVLRRIERVVYDYSSEMVVGSVVRFIEKKDAALEQVAEELQASHDMIEKMNVQLERESELVRQLSLTDSLTAVANRRHLQGELRREIVRSERYGDPLAIAMLDLDHFKAINDLHGHLVGDRVLIDVARRISNACRQADLVARFGGEEFCVLLPQTTADAAARLLERVRRILSETPIAASGKRVTVSVGVAEHRTGEGSDELLARADSAMYQAKAGGRDRVIQA